MASWRALCLKESPLFTTSAIRITTSALRTRFLRVPSRQFAVSLSVLQWKGGLLVGNCYTPPCDYHTTLRTRPYSSSSSSHNQTSPSYKSTTKEDSSGAKKAWRFFVTVVKNFMQGTKTLWADVKKVRQLQQKMGNFRISSKAPPSSSLPAPVTLEELQFVYKVREFYILRIVHGNCGMSLLCL